MSGMRLVSDGEARDVRLEGSAPPSRTAARDLMARGSDPSFAWIDGRKVPFRAVRRAGELVAIEVGGELLPVRAARDGDRVFVGRAGRVFEVRRERVRAATRRAGASAEHGTGLVAPMPGRIRKTLVRAGDVVEAGQVVLVLEAMKMEHAIRAPASGTVTRLDHAEGDLVEAGAVLAEIR